MNQLNFPSNGINIGISQPATSSDERTAPKCQSLTSVDYYSPDAFPQVLNDHSMSKMHFSNLLSTPHQLPFPFFSPSFQPVFLPPNLPPTLVTCHHSHQQSSGSLMLNIPSSATNTVSTPLNHLDQSQRFCPPSPCFGSTIPPTSLETTQLNPSPFCPTQASFLPFRHPVPHFSGLTLANPNVLGQMGFSEDVLKPTFNPHFSGKRKATRSQDGDKEVKKRCVWSGSEHCLFLKGLKAFGRGNWVMISRLVGTRSPSQVQSHAHKYYIHQALLKQGKKVKRSINDINEEDLEEEDRKAFEKQKEKALKEVDLPDEQLKLLSEAEGSSLEESSGKIGTLEDKVGSLCGNGIHTC
eukprot:GCRY01004027.1.p1 GENE.GCRY01004027.1~~GCRY01004027.1.p1  ORF type:complete len:353 (+),score=13.88 GCRY01004027.1:221-1279(+)